MYEEDERRKEHEAAIQRAIRNELDLHRQTDIEQRQRQSIVSHYQAQRRRKLMMQKEIDWMDARRSCTDGQRQPPQCATMFIRSHSSSRRGSVVKSDVSEDTTSETTRSLQSKSFGSSKHKRQKSEMSCLLDEDSFDGEELEEIVLE